MCVTRRKYTILIKKSVTFRQRKIVVKYGFFKVFSSTNLYTIRTATSTGYKLVYIFQRKEVLLRSTPLLLYVRLPRLLILNSLSYRFSSVSCKLISSKRQGSYKAGARSAPDSTCHIFLSSPMGNKFVDCLARERVVFHFLYYLSRSSFTHLIPGEWEGTNLILFLRIPLLLLQFDAELENLELLLKKKSYAYFYDKMLGNGGQSKLTKTLPLLLVSARDTFYTISYSEKIFATCHISLFVSFIFFFRMHSLYCFAIAGIYLFTDFVFLSDFSRLNWIQKDK